MTFQYLLSIFLIHFLIFKCSLTQKNDFAYSKKVDQCECGTFDDFSTRIVGGQEVKPHIYPWTVLILHHGAMHCGGTIINNRYIITAGHCIRWSEKKFLTVVLGMHKRSEAAERKENTAEIEEVILHENFISNAIFDENDIALIKLKKPLQYTPYVRPVCLPENLQDYSSKIATVAGWGRISFDGNSSTSLLKADLKVLSNNQCKKNKKVGRYIDDRMLCAYRKNFDACQGDSGGPLIYTTNDVTELIGIVSWGIGCATPDVPGVYTRITSYLSWIYSHTTDAFYCNRAKN